MNERISSILKNPWTIPVAVGVAAFGGGFGAGYIFGRRRTMVELVDDPQLTFDFDPPRLSGVRHIIEEEEYLSAATEPEVEVVVDDDDDDDIVRSTPIDVFVRENLLEEEEEDTPQPALVEVNVFENEDEDWDWEVEVASRNPDKPYILHRDEYHRDEMSFTQTTLTYYEGDDIMVSEDDAKPIYNHLVLTGPLLFGHGSGDPNVVLIRNEERRAEYEILRSTGQYTVEVLGLEIEENERVKDIKHSHQRKFRDTD